MEISKVEGKRPKTGGRTKGTPNQNTRAVKDMIIAALNAVGGEKYLAKQAEKNPKAFLALVGKVLPLQVTGEGGGPLQITFTNSDANL